jgi:hypothetical protein
MSGDLKLVLFILLLCLVPGYGPAHADAQAAVSETPTVLTVSGTLAMLDLSSGKGMLKTDLGKPIFFDVNRPDLFSRISIGDRVTVQLDSEGRTVKVIEALPAEVHEPPPPASVP